MYKKAIALITLLFLLSGSVGCSNIREKDKKDINDKSANNLSQDIKSIVSSSNITLKIKKKGDEFYCATPELTQRVLVLLKRADDGISKYNGYKDLMDKIDWEDYSYMLRFEGYKDIFVDKNEDVIFFEGQNNLAYSCWNMHYKLNQLVKETRNGETSYNGYSGTYQNFSVTGENEEYDIYQADINGDGIDEKLRILLTDDLELQIDDKRYIFAKDIDYYYDNSISTSQGVHKDLPNINITSIDDENHKYIIITNGFAGADNSHSEMWILNYEGSGKVSLLNNPALPAVISNYKNNIISVEVENLPFKGTVEINSDELQTFRIFCEESSDATPESVLSGKGKIEIVAPQAFCFRDYDEDGKKELCIFSFIGRGTKSYLGTIYLYYEFDAGNWKPINCFIDKNNLPYKKQIIYSALATKGKIKKGDASAFIDSSLGNMKLEELSNSFNELVKENVIFEKNDTYYINLSYPGGKINNNDIKFDSVD